MLRFARPPHAASAAAFGLVLVLGASPALGATAQRTFVASHGKDTDPCSLALPCRSFNAAIAQTNPGGEVVILDTAGYGPMVINKSIKVIGPSGVYGGISVIGGIGPPPPPTTGIVINAGDTDVVTLRGLDIAGVPGTPPLPLYGINIFNAGTVHIEKTSISNFTQDAGGCIHAASAKPIQILVNDSFLRECRDGIAIHGTGPDDASRIGLVVDDTRIEHGVTTGPSGAFALALDGAVVASLRNSVLAFAYGGVGAFNDDAAATMRVTIIGSQITRMGYAAVFTGGAPAGSVHVNVLNSTINNTANALIHGKGMATFTSNLIANNTNTFVDCGSSNVQSLSFGAGNGSNSVYTFTNAVLPAGCTAFIPTPTQFTGL